jgi:hypothetical protein
MVPDLILVSAISMLIEGRVTVAMIARIATTMSNSRRVSPFAFLFIFLP